MMAGCGRMWQVLTRAKSLTYRHAHLERRHSEMANWWEYYNLQAEPRLSPDPLTRREGQSLFIGRNYEQQAIKVITQGNSTVAVLITGTLKRGT